MNIKYVFIDVIFTQNVEFGVVQDFIDIDFVLPNKNVFSAKIQKEIDPDAFDFSVYNMFYDGEKKIIRINYNSGNVIKKRNYSI